jgi:hypothetical protein
MCCVCSRTGCLYSLELNISGGATGHRRNRQPVFDRKHAPQNSHQTHQYSFPAGVLADIVILESAFGRSSIEWAGRTVAIFSGAATAGYDLEFTDRCYYANRSHGSKFEPRRKLTTTRFDLATPFPGEIVIQAAIGRSNKPRQCFCD